MAISRIKPLNGTSSAEATEVAPDTIAAIIRVFILPFMGGLNWKYIDCRLFTYHSEKLVLIDDRHAEFLSLLELGRPHILAGKHIVGLLGYGA